MTERIIIAGSGGQGIMLLGKIIAEAALLQGRFVTWLPAYGPEVRGGAAHCMIIIADDEIGSPFIDKADTLIVLNQLSFLKFKSHLKDNGLMVVNSSLAKSDTQVKSRVVEGRCTDIAVDLGNIKVANVIALGMYLANKKIISVENTLNVIKKMAPKDNPELIKVNLEAFKKGMELVKNG